MTILRTLLPALLVCSAVAAPTAQAPAKPPVPAIDVTAKEIAAFINALPRDAVSDRPIRVVGVGGYQIGVYGVFRPKNLPGDAILHDTTTSEIYYMLKGSGTLVTGGTIAGTKTTIGKPGPNRGDRIESGTTRKVVAGDVVIIPGRTPHWWRELETDIEYLIFRPDPDSRLSPK